MRKKVFLTRHLLIAFLILLAGCSEQKPKIGLLMADYEVARWKQDQAFFVQEAEKLGSEVLVRVAESDKAKQVQQAKELINEGVKVIVIVPVSSKDAAKIVNLAHQHNVKVISYDRLIKNCDLDFFISFDNVKIGELQAEYLTKQQSKGKYALIGGPTNDNNSIMIKIGQMNLLQPLIENGDIQLVYDVYVQDWEEDLGYKHTKKLLKDNNDKIDAILCANDDLAKGAIRALDEKDMAREVLVAGQDGSENAKKLILEGKQTMTVYKPIEGIAATAAKVATKFAKNETLEDITLVRENNDHKMVSAILLPPMLVNKFNIKINVPTEQYLMDQKLMK